MLLTTLLALVPRRLDHRRRPRGAPARLLLRPPALRRGRSGPARSPPPWCWCSAAGFSSWLPRRCWGSTPTPSASRRWGSAGRAPPCSGASACSACSSPPTRRASSCARAPPGSCWTSVALGTVAGLVLERLAAPDAGGGGGAPVYSERQLLGRSPPVDGRRLPPGRPPGARPGGRPPGRPRADGPAPRAPGPLAVALGDAARRRRSPLTGLSFWGICRRCRRPAGGRPGRRLSGGDLGGVRRSLGAAPGLRAGVPLRPELRPLRPGRFRTDPPTRLGSEVCFSADGRRAVWLAYDGRPLQFPVRRVPAGPRPAGGRPGADLDLVPGLPRASPSLRTAGGSPTTATTPESRLTVEEIDTGRLLAAVRVRPPGSDTRGWPSPTPTTCGSTSRRSVRGRLRAARSGATSSSSTSLRRSEARADRPRCPRRGAFPA